MLSCDQTHLIWISKFESHGDEMMVAYLCTFFSTFSGEVTDLPVLCFVFYVSSCGLARTETFTTISLTFFCSFAFFWHVCSRVHPSESELHHRQNFSLCCEKTSLQRASVSNWLCFCVVVNQSDSAVGGTMLKTEACCLRAKNNSSLSTVGLTKGPIDVRADNIGADANTDIGISRP